MIEGRILINPCMDCKAPKRKPGCHSKCHDRELYLIDYNERKRIIEENKQKLKAPEITASRKFHGTHNRLRSELDYGTFGSYKKY